MFKLTTGEFFRKHLHVSADLFQYYGLNFIFVFSLLIYIVVKRSGIVNSDLCFSLGA